MQFYLHCFSFYYDYTYSSISGNHKIELGANWIHGVLGNPMYEIAMTNGLIDIVHVPLPHKVVAATEDGKQIPFKVLQVSNLI